jgi:hypothetical protein
LLNYVDGSKQGGMNQKKKGEKHNLIKPIAFRKKIELYGGEYVITLQQSMCSK